MVGAQQPLPVGQGLLVQGDRLGGAARGLVGDGEVVPRGQGVGVVGAQQPHLIGEQRLADQDRLRRAVTQIAQVA